MQIKIPVQTLRVAATVLRVVGAEACHRVFLHWNLDRPARRDILVLLELSKNGSLFIGTVVKQRQSGVAQQLQYRRNSVFQLWSGEDEGFRGLHTLGVLSSKREIINLNGSFFFVLICLLHR